MLFILTFILLKILENLSIILCKNLILTDAVEIPMTGKPHKEQS